MIGFFQLPWEINVEGADSWRGDNNLGWHEHSETSLSVLCLGCDATWKKLRNGDSEAAHLHGSNLNRPSWWSWDSQKGTFIMINNGRIIYRVTGLVLLVEDIALVIVVLVDQHTFRWWKRISLSKHSRISGRCFNQIILFDAWLRNAIIRITQSLWPIKNTLNQFTGGSFSFQAWFSRLIDIVSSFNIFQTIE